MIYISHIINDEKSYLKQINSKTYSFIKKTLNVFTYIDLHIERELHHD